MERSLEVRTGESIAFSYELAGLGSRFLAVALDVTIQSAVAVALLVGFGLLAGPVRSGAAALHLPTKTVGALGIALAVMGIFAIFVGYFIVFELWWSGRTPGKRALGIRVVRDAGFPVDLGAAVIRNLVRVLEFGAGFYTLSAISALVSRQNKRLGDFAAGTIVVRDRVYETADIDAYLAHEGPGDDGLDAEERGLVERYVARRAGLELRARDAIAARIAERVRPRLRASFDHLDDDALLEHLGRAARRD